ncbi:GerAB/ArcD/ProY family transporter [Virgibacillus pantothenticus]|uniref:GerAB/ArcD/ProY family transporter n=1 Tax=Virgibacillus pantothenticus TaxID=1473 RepID=UPI000985DDD8|nr:GerAB/ArcD/ProY family transporter [Virgibacillus pantothenticus]
MKVNVPIKANLQIRSFYLFFFVVTIQIGVGIMGVPRLIFEVAKRDAWISVIIAFVYLCLLLLVMLLILRQYPNADIFGIQVDLFGNIIGKLLGTIYIAYFVLNLFTILITYIEVVTIFIFPDLNNVIMAALLISLVVYSVLGGIRVVIGVCFLFFIMSHWLIFLLIQPILEIDWIHFQPMFQASITELLQGARETSYTFSGIELLFILYPFIQNKQKATFPLYLGIFCSSMIVLIATVVVLGYFTPEGIDAREWSVLGLYKIQSFSFIERFDYIVIAEWMMVSLPNMILFSWAITYGLKRLYHIPQKKTLYTLAIVVIIASIFTKEHYIIQAIINLIARYGFWIVYVYPFLILLIIAIKKGFSNRNKR